MTDDRLMLAAQAAGYSMIPPQESSETELETTAADASTADLASLASGYVSRLRSWLRTVPGSAHATAVREAVVHRLQSRAHA